MTASQNIQVVIGSVPIIIEIDERFNSVLKLIKKFRKDTRKSKVSLRIKIQSADKNLIRLSKEHNQLLIEGPDISNLSEPFNIVGVLQGVLRFAGLHSTRRGFLLLHASTSMLKDKALCFADDGKSIAKTLSSVETALISNDYIGDEFCFLNVKTNRISGYGFIPVHLRDRVRVHLETKHKMKLPPTNYKLSPTGYFISPSLLFAVKKSAKLNAFIFVHFTKRKRAPQRLGYGESYRALANTVAAHVIKLLNPKYDRMQFISGSDSSKVTTYDDNLVLTTVKKLGVEKMLENLAQNTPCFNIGIQSPCDIAKELSRLKL